MENRLVLALALFALASSNHGFSIRRAASLTPGLSAAHWSWLGAIDMRVREFFVRVINSIPGEVERDLPRRILSCTVLTTLQTDAILSTYLKLHRHNLARAMLSLLLTGAILSCARNGMTADTQLMISTGSFLLGVYGVVSWCMIRTASVRSDRIVSNLVKTPGSVADAICSTFTDLRRSALRQSVALGLLFVFNLTFQFIQLLKPSVLMG